MTAKTKAIIITLFSLPILVIGGLAVLGMNTPPVPEVATVVVAPQPPTVSELLTLVNDERAKVGVAPLTIDPKLNQSAQTKADDMFNANYFGHVDKNGKHGFMYATEAEPEKCAIAGENIYWGRATNTSEGALNWWKNSSPHYAAMTNSAHTITGFGIAGNKVVEHFC